MKTKYLLLGLALVGLAFVNYKHSYPSSVRPTGISYATGLPYNKDEGFHLFDYKGYPENRLLAGPVKRLPYDKTARPRQKAFFDSLAVNRQRYRGLEPPGQLAIKDNFFIDEAETTNLAWLEFLFYLKKDSTEEYYQRQLPDEKINRLPEKDYFTVSPDWGYEDNAIKSYLRHPAYTYYPVVGVTHEQVLEYCKWRSRMVNQLLHNANYKTKQGLQSTKITVRFRLPTEQEWELVASAGLDTKKYPYGNGSPLEVKYKVNSKAAGFLKVKTGSSRSESEMVQDIKKAGYINDIMFNTKRKLPYFLQFHTPFYVYAFAPNDFGIYNMIGNVAEMTAEKGIAKGGSWQDDITASKITDRQYYKGASNKVGFRCVSEVFIAE